MIDYRAVIRATEQTIAILVGASLVGVVVGSVAYCYPIAFTATCFGVMVGMLWYALYGANK